jgi:hypothetical protein
VRVAVSTTGDPLFISAEAVSDPTEVFNTEHRRRHKRCTVMMKMKKKLRGITAVAVLGMAIGCGGAGDAPVGPTASAPGAAVLTAPVAEGPVDDAQLETLRPTLTVRNGTSPGGGARVYEFQISDSSEFTARVASYVTGLAVVVSQVGVAEGSGGTTSFTPATDLQPSTRMYWRARFQGGSSTSAWSAPAQFRTKLVGFNRAGEMYDPLIHGETIGTRVGSTTFTGTQGVRVENDRSWVRYRLDSTLTSGEISVEVEGLQPNGAGVKSRIFSMMDGGDNLYRSKFLFNVQYRGAAGNPDNAISYKVLMGDEDLKYEPSFSQRAAGARMLSPGTTYLWTATWGSTFRLTVREGGATGPIIYERSQATPGTYNPAPHTVYLGANDAAQESGSYAGATYRNLWVGNRPRPSSLGSALHQR